MLRSARDFRVWAWLAAAPALALAACPFSNSPFEGDWAITDGGVTLICDGGTTVTPVVGPIVVIDGHASLVVAIDGYTETFDLSGDTAKTIPEKILLVDDGGFEDGWTLSLTSDALTLFGGSLLDSASGIEETSEAGQVCSFTRWFAATRESP